VAEGGGWGEEFRHARAEAKRFRHLALSQTSKQNNFRFLLRKIWRAGVKKMKENCFALLAEVRRAETWSGAIRAFFVQKRFELRSVIATRQLKKYWIIMIVNKLFFQRPELNYKKLKIWQINRK
jgi:hypothetical protein